MSDTLASLRWDVKETKHQLEKDLYYYRHLTYHIYLRTYLKRYDSIILNKENEIAMFIERADLVGRICIQNNLPAGDPCWMSEKIMSYV